jgi:hypothetical protein
MAKQTHTWKIGEYCSGGIMTVEITGKIIKVLNKEWDHSKGSRRSSDQSQAEVLQTGIVEITDPKAYRKLLEFINQFTTPYYTDQILDWIISKTSVTKNLFW